MTRQGQNRASMNDRFRVNRGARCKGRFWPRLCDNADFRSWFGGSEEEQ